MGLYTSAHLRPIVRSALSLAHAIYSDDCGRLVSGLTAFRLVCANRISRVCSLARAAQALFRARGVEAEAVLDEGESSEQMHASWSAAAQ